MKMKMKLILINKNQIRRNFSQFKNKLELEYVYGVIPVYLAIYSAKRYVEELLVQKGIDIENKKDDSKATSILQLCEKRSIPIKYVSKHDLNVLVENRPHQGFILNAEVISPTQIISLPSSNTFKCVLALDEITDPQNLGSILRSAFYFGVDKVVLCCKNSAPLSPVVSKTSAGALEVMSVYSTNNMFKFLDLSKESGWQVIGTSIEEKAIQLNEAPLEKPTILVLGNEGHGLRTNVLRKCDHQVYIPGKKPIRESLLVDSLNVGVCTGILLNHILSGRIQQ